MEAFKALFRKKAGHLSKFAIAVLGLGFASETIGLGSHPDYEN